MVRASGAQVGFRSGLFPSDGRTLGQQLDDWAHGFFDSRRLDLVEVPNLLPLAELPWTTVLADPGFHFYVQSRLPAVALTSNAVVPDDLIGAVILDVVRRKEGNPRLPKAILPIVQEEIRAMGLSGRVTLPES